MKIHFETWLDDFATDLQEFAKHYRKQMLSGDPEYRNNKGINEFNVQFLEWRE